MCGGAQKSIVVEQYPGMTKDHEGQVRNSAGNEVVWGYRLAMNAKAKETRSSAPVRTVEVDDPFRRGEFDRRYKQSDNAIPLHRDRLEPVPEPRVNTPQNYADLSEQWNAAAASGAINLSVPEKSAQSATPSNDVDTKQQSAHPVFTSPGHSWTGLPATAVFPPAPEPPFRPDLVASLEAAQFGMYGMHGAAEAAQRLGLAQQAAVLAPMVPEQPPDVYMSPSRMQRQAQLQGDMDRHSRLGAGMAYRRYS